MFLSYQNLDFNIFHTFGIFLFSWKYKKILVFIVDFEHVISGWDPLISAELKLENETLKFAVKNSMRTICLDIRFYRLKL